MNITITGCLGLAKRSIMPLAVVAALGFGLASPQARAETREQCHRRIEHAEHELHEAIERHGRHSRQAEHERRELRATRERCWREHHAWWDEHEHRWRTEHDWDDRDHDRDDYR
jgi:hypothetical protein